MLGFVIIMTMVQTVLSKMQNTFLILTKQGKDGRDSGDGDGNDGDIRKAQLTAVRFAVLPFYRLFCSTIEHYELYVKSVYNYSLCCVSCPLRGNYRSKSVDLGIKGSFKAFQVWFYLRQGSHVVQSSLKLKLRMTCSIGFSCSCHSKAGIIGTCHHGEFIGFWGWNTGP